MEFLILKTTVKEALFEVKGLVWEGDYRPAARAAIKELPESQIARRFKPAEIIPLLIRRYYPWGSFPNNFLPDRLLWLMAVTRQ